MGFEVIGFDVERFDYSGLLVIQDVRTLDGASLQSAALIVASPPCQEFSRHDQPWARKKNPPPPDLSIVEACYRIAKEAQCPMVLENVRGAQRFIGPPRAHFGSQYLWGDVPALLPFGKGKPKQGLWSTKKQERALIPFELARFIGQCYMDSL